MIEYDASDLVMFASVPKVAVSAAPPNASDFVNR